MLEKSITPSDGIKRTIHYKLWPNEVRVYKVFGDITDREALAEIAQQLAIEHGVDEVKISI